MTPKPCGQLCLTLRIRVTRYCTICMSDTDDQNLLQRLEPCDNTFRRLQLKRKLDKSPTVYRPSWGLLICVKKGPWNLNSRPHFSWQHSAKLMAYSKTTVCIILCVFPGNVSGLVTGVCPVEREQESE